MSVGDDGQALNWYELWRERCAAVEDIEERFGKRQTMEYIVGEKFVSHLKARPTCTQSWQPRHPCSSQR